MGQLRRSVVKVFAVLSEAVPSMMCDSWVASEGSGGLKNCLVGQANFQEMEG